MKRTLAAHHLAALSLLLVPILAASCDGEFCHSPGAAQVDLVSSGVESRVVDQMASDMGLCTGEVLVPADGSGGLLLEKIGGSPSCGSPMPIGQPLTSDELDCLMMWLMAPGGM